MAALPSECLGVAAQGAEARVMGNPGDGACP